MTTTYAVLSEGLEKRFGAVQALRGLDLAVATGTVCGILGPNGAGKTTAVRLLTTLLRPDAGSARIAGHDLTREAAAVRERIGVTGPDASVGGGLTGRQNLHPFPPGGGARPGRAGAAPRPRPRGVLSREEPTPALDPASRNLIWAAVRDLT